MKKVLVVEPNDSVRDQLKGWLEDAGYDVMEGRHGREALPALEEESVDAVTTAIFMEEMDGLELILTLRRRGAQIPIIAMTDTSAMKGFNVKGIALALGASAVIDDFSKNRVVPELNRLLDQAC